MLVLSKLKFLEVNVSKDCFVERISATMDSWKIINEQTQYVSELATNVNHLVRSDRLVNFVTNLIGYVFLCLCLNYNMTYL